MIAQSAPIPENLREAFHDAVAQFSDWTQGRPEPEVSFRRHPLTISAICRLVMNFRDPMPENLVEYLFRNQIMHHRVGAFMYADGARCLLEAINTRWRSK
jgi:hypothetical protein